MVVLPLKTAKEQTNIANVIRGLRALHAPTKVGDFATLHALSFQLRVKIEQVDELHYVGRIVECPVEEYVGETIEFDEWHIQHRQSPVIS